MKQTAVEWLASNLGKYIVWEEKIIDLIEQAREMENEQRKNAYVLGRKGGTIKDFNETFKSE